MNHSKNSVSNFFFFLLYSFGIDALVNSRSNGIQIVHSVKITSPNRHNISKGIPQDPQNI